jgi:hypothetical protein
MSDEMNPMVPFESLLMVVIVCWIVWALTRTRRPR